MMLSKEIAVYLNLVECKLKQYTAAILRQNEIDLTPEQFLLIDLLWNHGKQSQQQLADMMHKEKNSIKKLIDALERKKLVVRTPSTRDRRSNIIQLTEKAEALKESAKKTGIWMIDNIINGISEKDLRHFLATLDKMAKNMDTLPEGKYCLD